MLISVLGGFLYQWDTGRKICVTDIGNTVVSEIHIETKSLSDALVLTPEIVDSRIIASIPNIVLQTAEPITVYAMATNNNGRQTKYGQSFAVAPRGKPDDYVYTEEEILTYRTLENRINEIESNGVSQNNVAKAIEKYFNDHPIDGGVDEAQLAATVQAALREAKESGVFNGEPGQDGEDGFSPAISVMQLEDGYEISVSNKTETKTYILKHGKDGTDGKDGADGKDGSNYVLTSADKQDIASLVHVTAQDVSTALGYTPAKQDDVNSLSEDIAKQQEALDGKADKGEPYELIETIVCDGTYGTIRRNVLHKRVKILIHTTAAEAAKSVGIELNNSSGLFGYAWIGNAINTGERWVYAEAVSDEREGAYIEFTNAVTASYNSSNLSRTASDMPGDSPISRISIYVSGGMSFPEGTTIEIKAVGANENQ